MALSHYYFYPKKSPTGGEKIPPAKPKRTTEMSDSELVEFAKQRVPDIYYLSEEKDKLKFNIDKPLVTYQFGCHGEGNDAQRKVAKGLSDYINEDPKNRTSKVDFLLGDNIYANGASSPRDKAFEACFHKPYEAIKSKKIAEIGNHDEGIHNFSPPGYSTGIEASANEIAHTFLDTDPSQFIKEIDHKSFGKINIIHIDSMPDWTMLSRGGDVFVMGNVQFFCGNSNSLPRDFYKYFQKLDKLDKNPNINTVIDVALPSNQISVLIKADRLAKKYNRTVIISIHHPPKSPDKRAYSHDFEMYEPDSISRKAIIQFLGLNENQEYSNNEIVDACLKKLIERFQLRVHMVTCAHHHGNFYYNDSFLSEISENTKLKSSGKEEDVSNDNTGNVNKYNRVIFCLGGGGGELQNRLEFGSQAYLGGYFKRYGFGHFIISQTIPGDINVRLVTFDKEFKHRQVHCFNTQQLEPICDYDSLEEKLGKFEKEKVIKLCRLTKNAIDEYFKFLDNRQKRNSKTGNPGGKFFSFSPIFGNISHGKKGVSNAHKIWNFITQANIVPAKNQTDPFVEILNFIYHTLIDRVTAPHEHSLIRFLNKEFIKPERKKVNKEITIENDNQMRMEMNACDDGFGMTLEELWKINCNPEINHHSFKKK